MNLILENFLKKASTDQLHHLYILQNTWKMPHEDFQKTFDQFLIKYHFQFCQKNIEVNQFINCEDLLIVHPAPNSKNYSVEDLTPIFKFINYKARIYPRRLVVIPELSKLTDIVINKLLKILEEPPVPLTFFILNASNAKTLPTLESRAIKMKWGNFVENVGSQEIPQFHHIYDLIDEIKGEPDRISEIIENLLKQLGQNPTDAKKLQNLQNLVMHFEQTKTFHNSNYLIALEIFNLLKNP
jgi:hypothetical protein